MCWCSTLNQNETHGLTVGSSLLTVVARFCRSVQRRHVALRDAYSFQTERRWSELELYVLLDAEGIDNLE